MKRCWYGLVPLAAIALWASPTFAYPNLSPASRTGATALGGVAAEFNCTSCHSGTLNQSGGSVSTRGAATTPGTTSPPTTTTASCSAAPWNSDGSAICTSLRGTPNLRLMVCGHMSESSGSPS